MRRGLFLNQPPDGGGRTGTQRQNILKAIFQYYFQNILEGVPPLKAARREKGGVAAAIMPTVRPGPGRR